MARILVIDDDSQVRSLLRQALVGAGHAVREAENGAVGIDLFQAHGADLVITNVYMPKKDGMRTIRDLRRTALHMPIIAISGGPTRGPLDVHKTARWLGASKTFPKPFDVQAVLDAVRELLARSIDGGSHAGYPTSIPHPRTRSR